MISGEYKQFYDALLAVIPKERMFHDALSTLAYGTDASFYRMIPKLVIRARDEREIAAILRQADLQNIPLARRVRLHDSRTGALLRQTWSQEDGSYEFRDLSPDLEFDVIAWDHEGQFRSTIANNLKPEVLP